MSLCSALCVAGEKGGGKEIEELFLHCSRHVQNYWMFVVGPCLASAEKKGLPMLPGSVWKLELTPLGYIYCHKGGGTPSDCLDTGIVWS